MAPVAAHVIASDLLRDDGTTVAPSASLADALRVFAQHPGQTLPVVEPGSGQLTGREAARLDRGENRIDRMENRALADGTLSRHEKHRIDKAQDVQSGRIYRQKHDARIRPPARAG